MFVCTGNTCRSAMAHIILDSQLKEKKREDVHVFSSGISAENGQASLFAAIEAMKHYNMDLTSHKATNIRCSPIEKMDLILCMTKEHEQIVKLMYQERKEKVHTLKEYVGAEKDVDIKDPYGYDVNVYQDCINELWTCIEKMVENGFIK